MAADGIWRLFHWGPLIAYGIISYVSIFTLNFIMIWWPPNTISGFINLTVFLTWVALTVYNHLGAMVLGPGFVPEGWKPLREEDEKSLQYCMLCEGYKSPRSHHCRKCDRCVMKMDHHCPWINTCCGHRNHASFVWFLLFAPIGCIHASIILICCIYLGLNRNSFLRQHGRLPGHAISLSLYSFIGSVFAVGLAIGVVIAVGALLVIQLKSIFVNKTGIEQYIIDKARDRIEEAEDRGEEDIEQFTYPYDLGCWNNTKYVFRQSAPELSDGILWPVRADCDQYTFTREQLLQKNQKAERMVKAVVVRGYGGSWCPWSFGCRTCCCIPCTDEPRVVVQPNDVFLISRFRKRWIYGCKVLTKEDGEKKVKRLRGWFPRACAKFIAPDHNHAKQD